MRPALTVFFLFFGIAALDAVRGGHWLRVAFWLVIGAVFFLADRRQLRPRSE
jgi:membrane protein implicated in regulation of membrane protease activity